MPVRPSRRTPAPRGATGRLCCLSAALLLCLILLPAAGGCASDRGNGPIADTTMTQILIDLHLIRARSVYRDRPTLPDSFRQLRDSALTRRNHSQEEFNEMMDVYARDPERYEEIYTAVVDSLNKLRLTLSRADRDSVLLDSLLRRPQDTPE